MSRLRSWPLLMALCALAPACNLPALEGDVDYDAMFPEDHVSNWMLSFTNDDFHQLLIDQSTYVPAGLEVDGFSYGKVGARLVGNKNRGRISMRIRFDAFNLSLRFHGVKRVNLNNSAGDPSLVREALALQLMRRAGVPAPGSSFAWMSWDGKGEAGFVQTLVEQVDRRFLENRFGENDGRLCKLEGAGNLVYRGENDEEYDWYDTYELKTDWVDTDELETADVDRDRRALIGLMKLLDELTGEELEERLPEALDVDGFLLFLAVNTWLSNMDSYAGAGGNIYLYQDLDGRFRVIPWDLNRAFGNYHGRHCKHPDEEERCMEYGAAKCLGYEPDGREYCVESWAQDCADGNCAECGEPPDACDLCERSGCEHCEYTTDEMLALSPGEATCAEGRPLIQKVLAIPAFKEIYHDHLRALIDGVLKPEAVQKEMEAMRALISDRVAQDVAKEGMPEEIKEVFDNSFIEDVQLDIEDRPEYRVPGLIPFVQARDERIRNYLQEL